MKLPLMEDSDDFVFDNEFLVQSAYFGYRIGEITAPSFYHGESSSINFRRSVIYGFSVLWTAMKFVLQKLKIASFSIFDADGKKLNEK
jgi:hypothetical protein